jgi:hypothetical protein
MSKKGTGALNAVRSFEHLKIRANGNKGFRATYTNANIDGRSLLSNTSHMDIFSCAKRVFHAPTCQEFHLYFHPLEVMIIRHAICHNLKRETTINSLKSQVVRAQLPLCLRFLHQKRN